MDNIRIRAIEGERKGKGYAKDGERRRGEGGQDQGTGTSAVEANL